MNGEFELKAGDTVYCTYDPVYEGDGEYAPEGACHVTAISSVTVSFDNTPPHGGQTVCRSYMPGGDPSSAFEPTAYERPGVSPQFGLDMNR